MLQKDIHNVIKWFENSFLNLNLDKCKYLRISSNREPTQYFFDQKFSFPITNVKTEKDLGVIFDEKFSFKEHLRYAVGKARRNLGLIRNTFKFLDRNAFLCLYKSQVRPILEYCSPVWGSTARKKGDCKLLESVQKRATKFSSLKNLPYEDRLKTLELPTLSFRRLREDVIALHKICKDPNINYILNFKQKNIGTRGHSMALAKQRHRNNKSKNCLSNRILTLWNSLDPSFSSCENINQVKNYLDKKFLNNPIKWCQFPHEENLTWIGVPEPTAVGTCEDSR